MVDASFAIGDYICGDRFQNELGDIPSVFYSKIDHAPMFLNNARYIKKPFILVTHNGDFPVNQNLLDYAKTIPNLKKWFGQNIECGKDSFIESLPIGLENDGNWTAFSKRELLEKAAGQSTAVEPKKMLYLNFSFATNAVERQAAYSAAANRVNSSMVTDCCVNTVPQMEYQQWLNDVLNHHYILCPRGNGIDTHRLWETLYLGRIPVVKRDTNNSYYEDLPILFVNEWSEVTSDLLQSSVERLSNSMNFNMEKLKFSWWKDRIQASQKGIS